MQTGSRVAIADLNSRADLNHCGATLLSWDSTSGRWGVQVDGSGEKMRIKPANMRLTNRDHANEISIAIWDAAKDGKDARLSTLLASVPPGPWGDVADEVGSSALAAAAACGHPRCVALLLKSTPPPSIDLGNRFGSTPVHRAAEGGSAEVLRMLLQARGSPHAPDSQGQTPLCYAAEEGRTDCVRLLLEEGASPSAKYRGATPYQWALNGGHMQCAALLQGLAAGGDAPLVYDPKHQVPADDYSPQRAAEASQALLAIAQAKAEARLTKNSAKKKNNRAMASSEATPDDPHPGSTLEHFSAEDPLPPSDPPRGVIKMLTTVYRIAADDGGLSKAQIKRLAASPDLVLHLLKYVDGAAALTPGGERVLMGGIGVTVGDPNGSDGQGSMMAVAAFPWAQRVMQGWSAADWAWFFALSCHKFSDVLPPISTTHHYVILPSFKYAPADPFAWAARLERAFRFVAALPRFSSDAKSLFHKFAEHADLTACVEFSPMNFDVNGDAAYTFDTKWPWMRAAELLGVAFADRTATPALEYKFGDARKVLAADGRWFESAQDYIFYRCSAGAGEHVPRNDVLQVSTMMCTISSADQEATFRGQSHAEMMQAYCKRSKRFPMSRALKQAYELYGVLLPEAEAAGVIKRCASCGQLQPPAERFQGCPCGKVLYCSKECQKADWKAHKKGCTARKKHAAAEASTSSAAAAAAAVEAEMLAAHPGSNASTAHTFVRSHEQEIADRVELARRSGVAGMERLLDSLPPHIAQQIRGGGGNRRPLSREELQVMMPPGYSL